MNNKKNINTSLLISFSITTLGCIILSLIFFGKITQMQNTFLASPAKTTDIQHAFSLQDAIVSSIASASKSVVSISISKDIKIYSQDPSQMNGPGNIQQQVSKTGGGSGIIVSKAGYIITNKHVVQDTTAKYAITLFDGSTYTVDKVWFDDTLDIALLKIADVTGKQLQTFVPARFLPLATPVHIGQFVLTIGNTLGLYPNNVSLGIIGGKNKQLTINQSNQYIGLYQTDAVVNPGNSGGPLLDIQGNVLGITTAITEGEGIAFALPISKEFIDNTIKSIEDFGKIQRPIIGIQYTDTSLHTGIVLKDVFMDLPGGIAGLKIGDIIFRINDTDISQELPFLYQLYTYLPGDEISVSLIRNNQTMTLTIVLGGNTP